MPLQQTYQTYDIVCLTMDGTEPVSCATIAGKTIIAICNTRAHNVPSAHHIAATLNHDIRAFFGVDCLPDVYEVQYHADTAYIVYTA